jgi:hypothetical protein
VTHFSAHVRLFAPVDRPRIATGVENAEPTTAARTADETGQQGAPASSRLRVPNPAVGVAREQRLIAFVLRPTDVALVMILDEYLPRTHRLAVAIALARTTIDDRGALLALAVSVDDGIEGILQNRDDVTIPDWSAIRTMSTSGPSTGRESGRSATPSTTTLGGRSRVHGTSERQA